MLESIRTLVDIPPGNEVFLKREDIAAAKQRRLLMLEARDRAKAEVMAGIADAEQIRARAFREGYSEGVLLAATDIGAALIQSNTLIAQLREELTRVVKQLLGDVLMHEQLLDALLERWITDQRAEPEAILQIALPLECKSRHVAIREKLTTLNWPGASVTYHDQPRYLFRLADQVVELDVDATQQRLVPQILARIENLPESVRDLEYSSANVLIKLVENLIGSIPPDQPTDTLDEVALDANQ